VSSANPAGKTAIAEAWRRIVSGDVPIAQEQTAGRDGLSAMIAGAKYRGELRTGSSILEGDYAAKAKSFVH